MVKLVGIIIVAAAVTVGVASRFLFKKTDNVIEEIAEDIIEKQTGYDVDLSPDTDDAPDIQKDYDGKKG